jgi:hypothetical protein
VTSVERSQSHLVLILCISEFTLNWPVTVTKKSAKENIYCDKMGKIFNTLKSSLQESPIPTPILILITHFYNLKTLLLCVEFLQKIIPYVITEWK